MGDATEEIEKLNKNFDFIFIDAAKGQYKKFFEDSYKLLNEDGIVFIDNILFRGYLYKESPKRFKTIVKRLDEFINYLYENFNFVLLPISDGVGLSIKNKKFFKLFYNFYCQISIQIKLIKYPPNNE